MAAHSFAGFPVATLKFLKQLKRNNDREWFNERKPVYESAIVEPSLEFIQAMEKPMRKISECFKVTPKKTGGSLMRIYRDTRFSTDKTPYKTNIGIHFRHTMGGDVHAPGYYVHIEPSEAFLGVGIWHPATKIANEIRTQIDEDQAGWKKARSNKKFRDLFELSGDSLKRPPRGFDADHPWIEDLKRKDFIGVHRFEGKEITEKGFVKKVETVFRSATNFMRFLCEAIDVPM